MSKYDVNILPKSKTDEPRSELQCHEDPRDANRGTKARKCCRFFLSMGHKKHSELVLVWFRGNCSTIVVLSGTKFIGNQDRQRVMCSFGE